MKKTLIALTLISTLSMGGCMKHPSLDDEQRPKNWGTLISNTHNFYQISNDVFRSDQPSNELIPSLKQYNIDTVINLRARNEDAKVLKDQPFNLVHIPIYTWAINREDLLQAMRAIQTAKQHNQKVLIHCYHGSDRTGATIAMYRIIFEHWSIEDAVKEMKQGGYGFHVIWKNIDHLLSPENVKWIQQQLSNPSR
ncbi:dual specificity protein phosphatase-like protein [Acinetobacter sp. BIGb0102]|uniref:dual specificity protein phosphatase family protein n=1 Tax=Acinetobacter TaxID=469 RepID=UPI000645602C|nr:MULTISPECIES: dual specificity protein phosphatase family protein [Acinetobacter]MBJ8483986.1 dual specificity protein phosphatase family protein [Acinetobacter vivianii]OEC92555.1 protein tyrosine phosphatase [Acinetobacter sp. YK3]RPE47935.1 dual specificity protein phosphatase-like protein [Acinetobacter sp. BIGb0102]